MKGLGERQRFAAVLGNQGHPRSRLGQRIHLFSTSLDGDVLEMDEACHLTSANRFHWTDTRLLDEQQFQPRKSSFFPHLCLVLLSEKYLLRPNWSKLEIHCKHLLETSDRRIFSELSLI